MLVVVVKYVPQPVHVVAIAKQLTPTKQNKTILVGGTCMLSVYDDKYSLFR